MITLSLVWAQFRGLDLLDAATHFLTYQFPADNPDTHTRYHLLARPVWLLCGGNIVAFRLVCLGLMTGAALMFWRTWRGVLADTAVNRWTGLTLWLSAIAGLAWLPVVLGYNSLSTIFALIGLAALPPGLGFAAYSHVRRPARAACFGVFAVAVLAAALVKPPAALALAGWGGFLALWLVPMPRILRLSIVVLALAGIAGSIWLGLHWMTTAGSDSNQVVDVAGVSFSPVWMASTLVRYGREFADFLPALGIDLLYVGAPALGLAALLIVKLRTQAVPAPWVRFILGGFMAAWIAAVACRQLWDGSFAHAVSGEMARLYLVLWIALAPAWLVLQFSRRDTLSSAPLVIALFFLPLTCGFGSTNTLYFSALHWTVFWAAGLLLLSRSVATALEEPRLHHMIIGLLLLTAGLHLFSGHFLRPYMYQPSLWRQTEPVAISDPPTTLKLDPATARFLGEVRSVLMTHGYRAGDDVFGFFNLPGVVFALGAKQPGAPWYFGTWYGNSDTDGGKIRQVSQSRRQQAWILTQADVTIFRTQFHDAGIDFPDGYVKIGQTINPTTGLEIGIWKPKSRP